MANISQKILIVQIAGIGDLVLASRGIRAIRNGFPDAELHLITSTDASPIANNYPYVDKVFAFPIRELRKDKSYIYNVLRLLRILRKERYSQIINLYIIGSLWGAIKMGLLFTCLKSEIKIGHNHKGFGLFINKKIPREIFSNRHYSDAMLDMAVDMGGSPDTKGIEIFSIEKCKEKWRHIFSTQEGKNTLRMIGINPGGDRCNRRWNPDYFAILADWLVENFFAQVIILGGPGEEGISCKIESRAKNRLINLGGKLTLDELVYIISRLDLFITNDSGPMHIAAATNTPIVALFGPEDPIIMRPYTAKEMYRIVQKNIECMACKNKKFTQHTCLESITPEEVFEECKKILQAKKMIIEQT
ncbi:MAG: lipopolysaccharide heptosyltransferase II [Candidatus Brocadiales bacterium]|nr:lipopolysaccharide heptosyltransferase II [Candidatus Brocadiales bacterium]